MKRSRCATPLLLLAALLACGASLDAAANPPVLYAQDGYQSPVRGDPDDLLFLSGDLLGPDATVVYQAYSAAIPEHPGVIPTVKSPQAGVAPIVSMQGAPYQIIVQLPKSMIERRPYRIWVRNSQNEWSNGVSINDRRPVWFSPSTAYSSVSMAHLPRYLKVIGHNMLADNAPAVIRLAGRTNYVLQAHDEEGDKATAQHVATRRLPPSLEPGTYRVEVQSPGAGWTPIQQQIFTVLADPRPPKSFRVDDSSVGSCRPDDGRDDTECVAKALLAAQRAGGGIVIFTRGTWNIAAGVLSVPPNVDLRGQGEGVTRIARTGSAPWATFSAEFVLLGHNTVSGITFADSEISNPSSDPRPILQIGRRYNTDVEPAAVAAPVSDVVIVGNQFDKTDGAVVDGGNPIERLYVTYNQFGDYRLGLNLGGNGYDVHARFGITDAVISHNRFAPGSYLNEEIEQGAIASQVGASKRMDFSANVADGSSRSSLYAENDAPGWRAAFFWHMNDSHEMLLIANNEIRCSGDKDGDGEAIALDGNGNTFGLPKSELVSRSSPTSVAISTSLIGNQNNRAIDVDRYYIGHWLRINAGPGTGQSRRIIALTHRAGYLIFTLDLPWDVPPEPGLSSVTVARQYWQTMVIDNTVDMRKPLCQKSNRTRPKGGNISVWGQNSDSIVEGNRQFDTDGIVFEQRYGADEAGCEACKTMTTMPAFLEIRNNLIEGEYDFGSSCSLSGIEGSYSSSPGPHTVPPLLNFGVSISHNRITHADGLHGGAISIVPTWFSGPPGYAKPLVTGLAIHHNVLKDIAGAAPRQGCNYAQDGRYGIALRGDKFVAGTVLYGNRCENISTPLRDRGLHTVRWCADPQANSCECVGGN